LAVLAQRMVCERFHLTFKKWLAKKPPVATLAVLEAQIDRFVLM